MPWLYLNENMVDESSATVRADDRGFLLGDGLFETLRAYGGKPFRLERHLARMRESAAFLRLPIPVDDAEIARRIAELIAKNDCADAYVRLTLTRGSGGKGLRLDGAQSPTFLINVRPLSPYPPEQYKRGQKLIISSVRQNSHSALARHKTTSYLLYLLARQEATNAGANGALLLNEYGQVAEESVSNFFCVLKGKLVTPPVHCGLLPGIARETVLELAAGHDIPTEERPISAGEMFEAAEAFLTNSLMEVMPVRSVDKKTFAASPGPMTTRISELYRGLVANTDD